MSRALLATAARWGAAVGVVGFVTWTEHRRDVETAMRLSALEKAVAASASHTRDANAPAAAMQLLTWQAAQAPTVACPPAPACSSSTERAEPSPPSSTQAEHIARAQAILDDSLAHRTLRRADVLAMRSELLAAERPEAFEGTRQRIIVAINRNELVPEDVRFVVP